MQRAGQRAREDQLDQDIASYGLVAIMAQRDGRIRVARVAQEQFRKLIEQRSPAHVARLERERGLA